MDGHRSPLTARALWLSAAIPVIFLGWFFLYPLARVLWLGLATDPRPVGAAITPAAPAGVAAFTVAQALASTVLTLMIGLPVASVFARYSFPLKRTMRALITIPFVLPTVVVAAAFLALFGPRGVSGIDLEGTLAAILIAHVFYNVAVVVRVVGASWETIDPRIEEAATMLGASRLTVFRRVTLPLLRPAIVAASSLVFLFTFTSFGVVLILGGLSFETLEVAIYNRALQAFDLRGAALLSILQLVGVGVTLALYGRYQRTSALPRRQVDPELRARPPSSRSERLTVVSVLTGVLLLTMTPLAVLVWRSVSLNGSLTLSFYRQLGERDRAFAVPPTEAVANSLRFAIAAALIALVVGGLAAVVIGYGRGALSRGFDVMLMLPLGTSAVTVGFGFLIALDRPIDLRASAAIIPIAHALVAIPFVVRTAVPVIGSVQQRLREAAAVLGASPARAFREVDVPLVSRALLVGGSFAFAVSLGEFGATTFIARPDTPTLPIAIERFLGRPGDTNFGRAMAMAAILMVVTGLSVALIDRRRDPGGL